MATITPVIPVSWYAIWTRARHERTVRQQLADKGVEAFLPTITRWSRWRDRRKQIEWPLFPCYCFARLDSGDILPVLKCTGVLNIVSFGGKPAPVSETEVDNLRRLVGTTLKYDPCPLMHEGEQVRVTNGPLSGVVGVLLKKDLKHASVVLSVDLIGQAVRVEVGAGDIEPQ